LDILTALDIVHYDVRVVHTHTKKKNPFECIRESAFECLPFFKEIFHVVTKMHL